MIRPDWDLWFMRMAYVVAQRGTCPRKQVGCVIVDDDGSHAILASGYNGAPRGMPDCLQAGCELEEINGRQSCVRTLHAESNALDRLTQHPVALVLYTTVIPCHRCALRIRQNGRFVRVVYHEYYESQSTQKTVSVLANSAELQRIHLQRMHLPLEAVCGSYGPGILTEK